MMQTRRGAMSWLCSMPVRWQRSAIVDWCRLGGLTERRRELLPVGFARRGGRKLLLESTGRLGEYWPACQEKHLHEDLRASADGVVAGRAMLACRRACSAGRETRGGGRRGAKGR